MTLRRENDVVFLNEATATGAGIPKIATDFRNATFEVATDGGGTANFTIKFQWSTSKEKPDFDSAVSVSNIWSYIEAIDLEDGSSIAGNTGVSTSWADLYKYFAANADGLRWYNVEVTTYSAGAVTVKGYLFSND